MSNISGIFNINKPRGKTSFDMVALVKRLSGAKKVGHAGTLDPIATGVLPICLGQATKVVHFLQETPKTYLAEIELGRTTDTDDCTGRVIKEGDFSSVTEEGLEAALVSFRGYLQQRAPIYSALKYNGLRSYELARAGIEIDSKIRTVMIYNLSLVNWQPPFVTLEIECGKGTYIRSLAHDLGEVLGCGAHLKDLTRLRYGPFCLQDSLSPSELEYIFREGKEYYFLYPCDIPLTCLKGGFCEGKGNKDGEKFYNFPKKFA